MILVFAEPWGDALYVSTCTLHSEGILKIVKMPELYREL